MPTGPIADRAQGAETLTKRWQTDVFAALLATNPAVVRIADRVVRAGLENIVKIRAHAARTMR